MQMQTQSQCTEKLIQRNSAQSALDTASSDYMSCLPPVKRAEAALLDAQPAMGRANAEAKQLQYMNNFILRTLEKETGSDTTIVSLASLVETEISKIQKEIDAVKSDIRTERRRFLDADPQISPAAGGLYYTLVPDNRVLIAFLSCFGAFWLFTGILIIYGFIPLDALTILTAGERLKTVGILWVAIFVLMYLGFIMFT
jgi:hypothetical protein